MTIAPPISRRPRLPAVLREERQYRLLFTGQLLSILGDRMTGVVLPFAVLAVGGGLRGVALVSAAQFLPFAILALPAGVWADRLDRQRILIASDLIRFFCQATAGVLLLTGTARVTHLVTLAAMYGAADAFFAPSFTGLLPRTVAPDNIQAANALLGVTYASGSILGPVLAGILIAYAGGPGVAILFDAATFAFSVSCLVRLRPRAADIVVDESRPSFFTSLHEGWHEVRSRTWVRTFMGGLACYHVVVLPAIFVLGPVLAAREMDGARSWAIITTGFGIGSMLGNFLLLRWRPAHAMRVAALMLVGASTQAAIIGSGLPPLAIGGLEVLAGICVTGAFTLWDTSLQEHIPDHALSRVSSYDYLTSVGLIPVGNIVAGVVSGVVGLRPSLIGMSVIGVTISALIASVPAVRRLPRGTAATPTAVAGAPDVSAHLS